MSEQKFVIRLPGDKQRFLQFIEALSLDKPLEFRWKQWKAKRSLSANNLYWQWLTMMARHFSTKERIFDKEDMHDLMRHKFLGYEDKRVGHTDIPAQLKSTTKLNRSEFCDYMTKIDAWAAACGCFLSRPEDSEYERFIREQEAA